MIKETNHGFEIAFIASITREVRVSLSASDAVHTARIQQVRWGRRSSILTSRQIETLNCLQRGSPAVELSNVPMKQAPRVLLRRSPKGSVVDMVSLVRTVEHKGGGEGKACRVRVQICRRQRTVDATALLRNNDKILLLRSYICNP
jgi:hypothetical protein